MNTEYGAIEDFMFQVEYVIQFEASIHVIFHFVVYQNYRSTKFQYNVVT